MAFSDAFQVPEAVAPSSVLQSAYLACEASLIDVSTKPEAVYYNLPVFRLRSLLNSSVQQN